MASRFPSCDYDSSEESPTNTYSTGTEEHLQHQHPHQHHPQFYHHLPHLHRYGSAGDSRSWTSRSDVTAASVSTSGSKSNSESTSTRRRRKHKPRSESSDCGVGGGGARCSSKRQNKPPVTPWVGSSNNAAAAPRPHRPRRTPRAPAPEVRLFINWAEQKAGLSRSTVQRLLEESLTRLDVLSCLTTEDVVRLNLPLGEEKLLRRACEDLRKTSREHAETPVTTSSKKLNSEKNVLDGLQRFIKLSRDIFIITVYFAAILSLLAWIYFVWCFSTSPFSKDSTIIGNIFPSKYEKNDENSWNK